ncbi:unnamed protein product [Camellia sinensis]
MKKRRWLQYVANEYVANESLDKLLFSFEVCRRFMLGLLVLLPWCLLMAMVSF